MVYYQLKDKEAAYNDVEKAMEVAPERGEPYMLRAMLEFGDLKFFSAFKDYRKFKKLDKKYQKSLEKAKK